MDEILVPASRRIFPLLLLLAACGDNTTPPSAGAPLGGPVPGALADPARDVTQVGSPGAMAFFHGLLADTLGGDVEGAAAGYERALSDGALGSGLSARAALRWSALEAAGGRTRHAIELLTRASALGEGDPVLTDLADNLQGSLGLRTAEVEVRGPPIGTMPVGAEPAAIERFRRAEDLLARAHRLRIKPVFEAVSTSIRVKEQATEAAVRAYREVASDGPAAIAASYRIGSLYHDLALALVFELPQEFDPGVASRLRRSLRANTTGYLRRAVTAYRRALEPGAGADRWRAAAQSDLRGTLDLLGEP